MTTYSSQIIVGIFEDILKAKDAVDTMRTIGIRYDQIGVAFADSQNPPQDLANDLLKLGMSPNEASYYESAYMGGRIIVSVRPDNRNIEVQGILDANEAYSYETDHFTL